MFVGCSSAVGGRDLSEAMLTRALLSPKTRSRTMSTDIGSSYLVDSDEGEDLEYDGSTWAPGVGPSWLETAVNEQSLRFVDLATWKRFCAVSRRCLDASLSPLAWVDANIYVPELAMHGERSIEQVLKLAESWRMAKSIRLRAHPKRRMLTTELQKACPNVEVSVIADGPYCFFVMGGRCTVGDEMGLHFFEPRYRWMCQRILESDPPHMFAFVTLGCGRPGSRGVLCEVKHHRRNSNGTFDVQFIAQSAFYVVESWTEDVPDHPEAPSLAVGLLDITAHNQKRQSALAPETADAEAQSSCFRFVPARAVRLLQCCAGALRCCRRRQ